MDDGSVGDWEGTLEFPRNQIVLVNAEGLPGVYMARIIEPLENCGNISSSNAGRSKPLVVVSLHWWYLWDYNRMLWQK